MRAAPPASCRDSAWRAPTGGAGCAPTSSPASCSPRSSCPRAWPTPSWPGCPPVNGLYTTIACLVGYAIMGPSPVLVLGPDSSLVAADLRRDHPARRGRRRPGDGDRARRHAGHPRRAHRDRARRRPSSASSPTCSRGGAGRLHERARHHDHRRPAPEAVRLLDRRRRLRRRGARSSSRTSTSATRTALAVGLATLAVLLVLPRVTRKVPAVLVAVVGATVVTRRLRPRTISDRRHAAAGAARAGAAVDRRSATSCRCSSPRSGSRSSR